MENKIKLIGVTKMSSVIDLNSKYMWAISNIDMDVAKDLGLTNVKKC